MTEAALRATMEALRLDRLAVEVSEALCGAGCDAVLLKGASTARWLYADGTPRAYGDVDLLIDRRQGARIDAALAALGFVSLTAGSGLPDIDHADNWMRRSNEFIDLHFTLPSASDPSPEHVWSVLADHHETWSMAGGRVRVLDPTARAVVVVLHAIHHGPAAVRSMTDLHRLLARLEPEDWRAAAALAVRLGVENAFAAGLRLLPDGAAIARTLDLSAVLTPDLWLKSVGVFDGAHNLERLSRAATLHAAIRLVLTEVFPRPAGLRRHSALAHRGPLGLVAAYAVRPLLLARQLPGVVRSWIRARREAGRARPGQRAAGRRRIGV